MANGAAWDQGWSLGKERVDEARQHKQNLSDLDLERRANELVDNRKAIQQKLPTLLDENNQPTPEYNQALDELTENTQSLRELFHPEKNPGAIAKFGHILTDHLHITNPQERAQQEQQKQAKLQAGDRQQAESLASAAPLSPQQQAQAASAKTFANIQAQFNDYDKLNPHAAGPDATPEEKAKRQAFRDDVTRTALKLNQHPNWKKYKLPGDPPRYEYFDVNRPDTIPPGATAEGPETADQRKRADYEQAKKDWEANHPGQKFPYSFEKWGSVEAQKPSTSAINVGLDSYAASHGFDNFSSMPAQYKDAVNNYEIRKQALDKAYPVSTTTTTYQENYLHQKVPVVAINYRTPGGIETLKDPLWFLAKPIEVPGEATPAGRKGETGKATPKSLTKEAQSRKPANKRTIAPTSVEGAWQTENKPKRVGNVTVGKPLFATKNKEYDDTSTALDSAKDRVSTMDKNLKSALNGDQQAMLSLVANHIGMTLGAQKGARINQAVWNEAVASAPWAATMYAKAFHNDPNTGEMVFDGWKGGVNLTPEQMKQMVNLAHEREQTLEVSLKRIVDRLNQGVQSPSDGTSPSQPSSPSTDDKDIDAIITALNATKK